MRQIFSSEYLTAGNLTDLLTRFSLHQMTNTKKLKRKTLLLGVGLDSDRSKRISTGPNFALVGGLQETHEVMTEKTIKLNEKLKARGKQLETVSHEEFDDIAQEVGLKKFEPKPSGRG
jgi:hypothetical protein